MSEPEPFIQNMLDLSDEFAELSETERRFAEYCGALVRAEMRRIAAELDAEIMGTALSDGDEEWIAEKPLPRGL